VIYHVQFSFLLPVITLVNNIQTTHTAMQNPQLVCSLIEVHGINAY